MSNDIDQLLAVMARLRDPDTGCPWDREQTFSSIAPYTIEEAYEVADAIEHDDMPALCDELGDLLLQVVYHARMAEERGAFAFRDVVAAIHDKMIRRHPHVFGAARVDNAAAQTAAWEEHKAAERRARAAADRREDERRGSALDGVPRSLPALMRAAKLQGRAARVGFDWPDVDGVLAKIAEETAEIQEAHAGGAPAERIEDEVGDLLFTCVNLARRLAVDAEHGLRRATAKFERRFRRMEALFAADAGSSVDTLSLAELDALWERAKAAEEDAE